MGMLTAAVSGLVILCIGGVAGFFVGRIRQSRTDARLAEVETEFSAYREQVAAHYSKTADQFHAIGLQYRELYEHLAAGSETLGILESPAGDGSFPPAIDIPDASSASVDTNEDRSMRAEAEGETEDALPPEAESPEVSADPTIEAQDEPPPDPEVTEQAPDNVVELVPRDDAATEDEAADPDERTYH